MRNVQNPDRLTILEITATAAFGIRDVVTESLSTRISMVHGCHEHLLAKIARLDMSNGLMVNDDSTEPSAPLVL